MRRLALAATIAIPCWTLAGILLWNVRHPFLILMAATGFNSVYLGIPVSEGRSPARITGMSDARNSLAR